MQMAPRQDRQICAGTFFLNFRLLRALLLPRIFAGVSLLSGRRLPDPGSRSGRAGPSRAVCGGQFFLRFWGQFVVRPAAPALQGPGRTTGPRLSFPCLLACRRHPFRYCAGRALSAALCRHRGRRRRHPGWPCPAPCPAECLPHGLPAAHPVLALPWERPVRADCS